MAASAPISTLPTEPSMRKPKQHKPLNDLSRSLTPFDPDQSLIAVIELSKESWRVAGTLASSASR